MLDQQEGLHVMKQRNPWNWNEGAIVSEPVAPEPPVEPPVEPEVEVEVAPKAKKGKTKDGGLDYNER